MTKKRIGEPWMPADEYGRSLPCFTVNLIVRDMERSAAFYRDVLGAGVHYADPDFAALRVAGLEFMLHADHAYDAHPLHSRLSRHREERGTGIELRLLGVNPNEVEARAKAGGASVVQSAADKLHGWREVMVADPDGYVWAVGVPIKK